MTTCFCGCGREIKGVRKKANNTIAVEIAEDVAVMEGALTGGSAGDQTKELAEVASEGRVRLTAIREFLHDEAGRGEIDKSATRAWLVRARSVRRSLETVEDGPSWLPDQPGTDVLVHTGERAAAVISAVDQAGWGNERVAELRVTVTYRDEEAATVSLTRDVSVRVTEAPRVGDQVEIAFDRDSQTFAYRPRVVIPD